MRPPQLELHVTLALGREVECARFLRGELSSASWAILANLAAEIVALHETAAAGATRVLIVPAEALAETKLADLDRLQSAARGRQGPGRGERDR